MKLELELDEIKNIRNLIVSRINDLRESLVDDSDKEEELKEIIRDYKKIVKKMEDQIDHL